MPLPHTPQQPDFDHGHQIFQMVGGVGGPNATPGGAVAPVASMGPSPINPYLQSQNQHQQHEPFLDPALMGQGGMDLQRVAGEAMQQVIGEDENDQQVRTKLVSYIQGEDLMGPA